LIAYPVLTPKELPMVNTVSPINKGSKPLGGLSLLESVIAFTQSTRSMVPKISSKIACGMVIPALG